MITRINPTRMELTKLKKRLVVAKRGYKLLKDKQDEMIRQFMMIIRYNRDLRNEVEKEIHMIINKFTKAMGSSNYDAMKEALLIPAQPINVELGLKTVMNITTTTVSVASQEDFDLTYGFAFTSAELDDAVLTLQKLLPKMAELAEIEKRCDMLAFEIEKTRRRVNAIEFVMIPEIIQSIKYIAMKLDDNERSNIIRLMKSKEIILNKENA